MSEATVPDVQATDLVDEELRDVILALGETRNWGDKDNQAVMRKLRAIKATTVPRVKTLLNSNQINGALRRNGFKALSADTIGTLSRVLKCKGSVCGVLRSDSEPATDLDLSVYEPEVASILEHSRWSAGRSGSHKVDVASPRRVGPPATARQNVAVLMRFPIHNTTPPPSTYPDFMEVPIISTEAKWHVIHVPLSSIFFYQATVASSFSCGLSLQFSINQLRLGEVTPESMPLIYVLLMDGRLYGMGTRRLVCFHHVWGETDPHRSIPVLFCGKRCVSSIANEDPFVVHGICFLWLEGTAQKSFKRPTCTLPPSSAENLLKAYDRAIQPIAKGENLMYPKRGDVEPRGSP